MYNASSFTFKQARLAIIGGADTDENKIVGTISAIMRVLTNKTEFYYLTLIKLGSPKTELMILH